jgi:DNA replication protein DnaC
VALRQSEDGRTYRPDLLILDELGYLPCDSRAADIIYNIVSRRHEDRSLVITTNLAFKQWGTVFSGAACVALSSTASPSIATA